MKYHAKLKSTKYYHLASLCDNGEVNLCNNDLLWDDRAIYEIHIRIDGVYIDYANGVQLINSESAISNFHFCNVKGFKKNEFENDLIKKIILSYFNYTQLKYNSKVIERLSTFTLNETIRYEYGVYEICKKYYDNNDIINPISFISNITDIISATLMDKVYSLYKMPIYINLIKFAMEYNEVKENGPYYNLLIKQLKLIEHKFYNE